MLSITALLGNGLIKKEKKVFETRVQKTERESRKIRKKVIVEMFLREILGTHLIEKKF
jgi:hypothetical protein